MLIRARIVVLRLRFRCSIPYMGLQKAASEFRNYSGEPTGYVREFYRKNHEHQTVAFVEQKKAEYLSLARERMTVWEMLDYLNDVVDESDPDTNFTQTDH
ncbi:MAG TPA: inositol oxygenase family protein, partial [Vicinamibacterales bacterium]